MEGPAQPRGEDHDGRVGGGVGQLVVAVLEHRRVGAYPLGEELLDESRERLMAAGQRGQVLERVVGPADLLPVLVVLPQLPGDDAHPGERLLLLPFCLRHDPAPQHGRQHHPDEGFLAEPIVRVRDDPQRGDQVAHDRVVLERASGRQAAGNSGPEKLGLQGVADLVPAVQQPVFAPGQTGPGLIGHQIGEDPAGFRVFIREAHDGHRELGLPLGAEGLPLEQARVLGEQQARGLEDLPRRAAVLVEHYVGVEPEVVGKLAEHARVRTGPGVDRLVVVTDDEQVPVLQREPAHHGVLSGVEILEFVHQQVIPARRHLVGDVVVRLEEIGRVADQVVEVHQVALLEKAAIPVEEREILGGQLDVTRTEEPEPGEQPAPPLVTPDPEPAEHILLVLVIGNAESAAHADAIAVLAQDLGAEGVEGAAFDRPGAVAERGLEAFGDFLRGFVGKGDGADPRGIEALALDQEADALDQAEGLPRPGAGQDEHGAEGRLDGLALAGRRRECGRDENGGH